MLAGGSGSAMFFSGVRFVFFGFDSVSEAQYRSEIVRRGGVDVCRYEASCTHVIVSGRVFDDPVCVAARNDRKTLVTELWVDDSLDFGTLADATRILYRPVKDLSGIPGSEPLFICLTGYQRQDRDDIMKMVSLMGARFSKPLIANQVTHLICYKFEGEKYELARKVGIKLVNHRWLEDCLKEWEILPTDSYTKSGWELEMLEAQARDSEDETENAGGISMQKRRNIGSSGLPVGVPVSTSSGTSIPTKDNIDVGQDAFTNNQSHNVEDHGNEISFITPSKDTSSEKPVDICRLETGIIKGADHQSVGGIQPTGGSYAMAAAKSNSLSSPCEAMLRTGGQAASSNSRKGETSPTTAAAEEKFGTLSYSRRARTNIVSAETPNNLSESGQVNLEGTISMVHSGNSPLISRESGVVSQSADIQWPSRGSPRNGDTNDTALPQKRKSPSASSGLTSLKAGCQYSNTHPPLTPSASLRHARSDVAAHRQIDYGIVGVNNSSERVTSSKLVDNEHAIPSKFKSLSYRKRSLKGVQPAKMAGISGWRDSTDGVQENLPPNLEARNVVDDHTRVACDLPSLHTPDVCAATSNQFAKAPDLSLIGEKKQIKDPNVSIIDASNCLWTLSIDGKSASETPGKEPKAIEDGNARIGNGANSMRKEIELSQHANQDEVVVFSDSKESENRRHSSIGSADTCKEEAVKAAYGAPKKAVARKKVTSKTKLCADSNKEAEGLANSDKVETLSSSNGNDTSTPSTAKAEKVENLSKELRLAKGIAVLKSRMTEKTRRKQHGKHVVCDENVAVEPVSEDVIMEDVGDGMRNSMPERNNMNIVVDRDTREASKEKQNRAHHPILGRKSKNGSIGSGENSMDQEKENKPNEDGSLTKNYSNHRNGKVLGKSNKNSINDATTDKSKKRNSTKCSGNSNSEAALFLLSGHRLQRKEFQKIIKQLRGRLCRDSHQWSYQATHFVVPDPVRRTEKFFAAAASGRWILNTDYLTASNEAGKFLDEESFEWHKKGLTEDGAINLEAPRKWRLLRERTGHGAFYGMRIIIYGECIAPTLDTLKRAVKAGDGTILATSPPYTRFLKSGVDYAIVSPSMPRVDIWVQEFLRHEVPCIVADYLVDYVCKPGYSLDKHVLYSTHAWAEKSLANLSNHSEEVITDTAASPEDDTEDESDDLSCAVCGSRDRADVMLVCGDENGVSGCGIGTHIQCCDPPLDDVPEEDWFCPKCCK